MVQQQCRILFLACALSALALGTMAQDALDTRTEEVVRRSFQSATPEEWQSRLAQDKAQAVCSQYKNTPPADLMQQIAAEQWQTLTYPADGQLMGDWRAGEKLAASGRGGHIGKLQPDPPGTPRGGNCYACHALAPHEVAAGNLGPSLTAYGKIRGNTPEMIKYTYEKIFNAQAFVACSTMPRFGHHGWLTPQEIAHTVAFLLHPESPVNIP